MNLHRVISMFYELKDANTGEILESNLEGKDISFVTGKQQILQKLEDEINNLKAGENKIVKISAKEGVGEYDSSAIQSIAKEQFAGIDLVEGMELLGESEDGQTTRVIVKAIGDEEVMVDFNHPYAGKDLEFNVKIIENREATEDEIAMGIPAGAKTCGCANHGHNNHECCGEHSHENHECCGGHGHHHDDKDGGCGCGH